MKYLCKYIIILVSMFIVLPPALVLAEDKYGIGGDDYIVDHGSPDLLDVTGEDVYDPFEPVNRVFFTFNDKLYFWVLKPVKKGYSAVVPSDFRMVIGNFFNNLAAPVDFANTLLQGRFNDAGVVLGRFLINSTIGVFGFGDIAAEEFDLAPERGDFGETLGVYGIGEGIYLCWPFLGPSNIRDSVGLFTDMQLHPYAYTGLNTEERLAARGEEYVNRLSITPDSYEEIKNISLDPYVATRQAYADYRRSLISSHGKQSPEEQE